MVLLLKIGPGKAVISINNRTQQINLLERKVFQLLRTLNIWNLKFWPQIWKELEKSFPKIVLLLKIGPGKAVISINNHTQKIPWIPFQTICNSAFFWVIQVFPTSTCIGMVSCQSLKSEKKLWIILIYGLKCSFFRYFFRLWTLTLNHF